MAFAKIDVSIGYEAFSKTYIHSLPANHVVVKLALNESKSHLLLCRLKSGSEPITVRLPLKSVRFHPFLSLLYVLLTVLSCLSEMADILEMSKNTLTPTAEITEEIKADWWKRFVFFLLHFILINSRRYALDERLQHLVDELENEWLGAWKSILLGSHTVAQRSESLHAAV